MAAFGIPVQDALARSLIDSAYAKPGGKPTSRARLRTGQYKPAWAWLNLPPYNKPFDVVSGSPMTITGATVVPSPFGWEFSGNGNSHRLEIGSVSSAHPLSLFGRDSDFTLVGQCYWDGGLPSNYPRVFDKSNGGGAVNGYSLYVQDVGSPEFVFQIEFFYTAVPVVPGRIVFVVVPGTATNEKVLHVWNAGSWKSPVSVTRPFPSTTTNASIGNWNDGATDRNWSGTISGFAVFHHNKGELLGKRVALDMWRYMLEPANESPFAIPVSAGGGGISVTLDNAEAVAIATDPVVILGGVAAPIDSATAETDSVDLTVALGAVAQDIGEAVAEVTTTDLTAINAGVSMTLTDAVAEADAEDLTIAGVGVSVSLSDATAEATATDLTSVLGTIAIIAGNAIAEAVADDLLAVFGGVAVTIDQAEAEAAATDLAVVLGVGPVTIDSAHADAITDDVVVVFSGVAVNLDQAIADAVSDDIQIVYGAIVASLTDAVAEALADDVTVAIGASPIVLDAATAEFAVEDLSISLSIQPITLSDAVVEAIASDLVVSASGVSITLDAVIAEAYTTDVTVTIAEQSLLEQGCSIVYRITPSTIVYRFINPCGKG